LAFTPEDLAKFEADPFRIFRSFSFFTTIKEARPRHCRASGATAR
jgi:hypothetical protein